MIVRGLLRHCGFPWNTPTPCCLSQGVCGALKTRIGDRIAMGGYNGERRSRTEAQEPAVPQIVTCLEYCTEVEKRAVHVTLLARDHSELDMNGRSEARVPCRLDDVKRLSIVRGRFGEIASRERRHT